MKMMKEMIDLGTRQDGVLRDRDSTRREDAWSGYDGLGSLLQGEYGQQQPMAVEIEQRSSMEQNTANRYTWLLGSATPDPPHVPTPPLPNLDSQVAAMEAVVAEVYVPTPEPPLPTTPAESLNNLTLVPTQMPEGFVAIPIKGPVPTDALLADPAPSSEASASPNTVIHSPTPNYSPTVPESWTSWGDVTPSPDAVFALKASRLLDAWMPQQGFLNQKMFNRLCKEYTANMVGNRHIWELSCWMHRAPVPKVRDFLRTQGPDSGILEAIQHAFATRLTRLRGKINDHSPHVDGASIERAMRRVGRANPIAPPLSRRPSLSFSEASGQPAAPEGDAASDASSTPMGMPALRDPPDRPMTVGPTPSSHSSIMVERGDHPRVPIIVDTPMDGPWTDETDHTRSPPTDMGHARGNGRMTARAHGGPEAPSSSLDVPRWSGDTQEQEAKAIMDELRAIAARPRPDPAPLPQLTQLPPGASITAWDWADTLASWRIGYAYYLQNGNINPVRDGAYEGPDGALGPAFLLAADALGSGVGPPLDIGSQVVASNTWFRCAAIALSAITQGVLVSDDFFRLGAFPVRPCPDAIELHNDLPVPASQIELLQAMTGQLLEELSAKGISRLSHPELWQEIYAQERDLLWQVVWDSDEHRVWRDQLMQDAKRATAKEALQTIIANFKAEGAALMEQISLAERVAAKVVEHRAGWSEQLEALVDHEKASFKAEWEESLHRTAMHEAQAEWRTWKETELAKARAEAMNRISLDYVIQQCGTDAEAMIAAKRDFARDFVAHNYQGWVDQALSEKWPQIEQRAQEYTREQYLQEELARIWPDVRDDARKEVQDRVAKYKADLEASLATKQHAKDVKKEHAALVEVKCTPAPPTAAEETITRAVLETAEYKNGHPNAMHQLGVAIGVIHPFEATVGVPVGPLLPPPSPETIGDRDSMAPPATLPEPPLATPSHQGTRSVASSMHTPGNQMEDDAPAPEAQPSQDTLIQAVWELLAPLQAGMLMLTNRVEELDRHTRQPRSPEVAVPVDDRSPAPAPAPVVTPPAPSSSPTPPTSKPKKPKAKGKGKATVAATGGPEAPIPTPAKGPATAPTAKAADNDGFISVGRCGPTYNSVTVKGIQQNTAAHATASSAANAQGHTATGALRRNAPTSSPSLPTIRRIVVVRNGGLLDEDAEKRLRITNPGFIVQGVRTAIERQTSNPLRLLVERTGNFVYHIAGKVPMTAVLPFSSYLLQPFPGATLVPAEGWCWAQLHGVLTAGSDSVIYDEDQLTAELHLNLAFETTPLVQVPHWATDPFKISTTTSTVVFAYIDPDKKITQAAVAGGISMFSYGVKFVPCGDSPHPKQCGRCHEMGHVLNDTACKWKGKNRCICCGGAHHTNDHAFHCKNTHKDAARCDCRFPCLLCKKVGHTARSHRACASHGDFPAPQLVARIETPTNPAPAPQAILKRPTELETPSPAHVDNADPPLDFPLFNAAQLGQEVNPTLHDPTPAEAAASKPAPKVTKPKARIVRPSTDTAKPGETSTERAATRFRPGSPSKVQGPLNLAVPKTKADTKLQQVGAATASLAAQPKEVRGTSLEDEGMMRPQTVVERLAEMYPSPPTMSIPSTIVEAATTRYHYMVEEVKLGKIMVSVVGQDFACPFDDLNPRFHRLHSQETAVLDDRGVRERCPAIPCLWRPQPTRRGTG
ncbi:hypothetical protein EDB86DRAFT_2825097 [Lactarius hatsudake]|nr:hypothetical protein EDB86DRAFT_2825097 [Lactarius hatsudake]